MFVLAILSLVILVHVMDMPAYSTDGEHSAKRLFRPCLNVADPTETKELWYDVLKRHFVLPYNTAYGGHAVILFAALYATDGAVLELGSGLFSTPIIHNVAVVQQGRDVFTVDADSDWLQHFTSMGSPHHSFGLVSSAYPNQPYRFLQFRPAHFRRWEDVWDGRYGLVFVDQTPEFERRKDIQRRRNVSDVMIVHDTNDMKSYGYEPLLSTFPYRYKFRHKSFITFTDVIADKRGDLIDKIRKLSEWTCEYLGLGLPRNI